MYSKDFTVEIVTPVETKFQGTVQEVILPGIAGEMAVLGGHAPLLTMLRPGVTVAVNGAERTLLSTGEGFATIAENRVVCLVDFALSVSDLDFPKLREELAEVSAALAKSPSDAALRTQKTLLESKLKAESHGS